MAKIFKILARIFRILARIQKIMAKILKILAKIIYDEKTNGDNSLTRRDIFLYLSAPAKTACGQIQEYVPTGEASSLDLWSLASQELVF